MTNGNGTISADETTRTRAQLMANYDSLPAELRLVLQNAHHNLFIKPEQVRLFRSPKILRDSLLRMAREDAVATYGRNYPVSTVK